MEASSAIDVLERKPELKLAVVTINDMPDLWPQIEPLLARACDYTAEEMTPASVLHGMGLHDGVVRLHMLALGDEERGITSIMVAAVCEYPTKEGPWVRKFDLLATSGENVSEWMPFEEQMDALARKAGCISVRIPRARRGWVKVLPHWQRRSGDCCVLEREI